MSMAAEDGGEVRLPPPAFFRGHDKEGREILRFGKFGRGFWQKWKGEIWLKLGRIIKERVGVNAEEEEEEELWLPEVGGEAGSG